MTQEAIGVPYFAVLGPLRGWRDGDELELGTVQQRCLLALLLVRAGEPVGGSDIADVLWGEHPPASASNLVHRYVGALRRLLEPGLERRSAGRWLARSGTGYRLDVGPSGLDLLRLRQLVAEARRAAAHGEGGPAVDTFRLALDLWRGPCGADLPVEARHAPVFRAVDQECLSVVREATDLALQVGQAERMLAPVRQAASWDPLNESVQACLILTLAACGRQAEALAAYDAVRQRLAGELGIDPGPELCAAQARVLQQDVGVRPPRRAAETAAPAAALAANVPPPAQLPADPPAFAGRDQELAELDAAVAGSAEHPDAMVIAALSGTAGVGKTALAVHWARRVADRFPDGQMYVNLRGFDPGGPATTPAEAIRGFLHALAVPVNRIPSGFAARGALYRGLVADRRMLIVLDNARDAEQVRPLLPGAPGCLVVVTSRDQLSSLVAVEGARPLTVEPLTVAASRQLLTGRLGSGRVDAEPAAVERIVAGCARLPLALTIVAARAATRPGFTLADVARELGEAGGELDALSAGDAATDLRSVFAASYGLLRSSAAALFRLLSLHPGPDVSAAAAASLAGVPVARVRPLLTELARVHLLAEPAPGRYSYHSLMRAYARELADRHDRATDRRVALHRLLDHYLHTAHVAAVRLASGRDPVRLTPSQPGVTPERLSGHDEAAAWFTAEEQVLMATVELASAAGFDGHARDLVQALAEFIARRGLPGPAAGAGRARNHLSLALAAALQCRYQATLHHAEQALRLFRADGDPAGEAMARVGVWWSHIHLGDGRRVRAVVRGPQPRPAEITGRRAAAKRSPAA